MDITKIMVLDSGCQSETIRWTIDDAKRIKAEYRAKYNELLRNRKEAAGWA